MKDFRIDAFPVALHETLEKLAEENEISGYAENGASGYVVFGKNNVLKRDVAIKFYYWENGDHAEPELLAKLDHKNVLKIFHAAPIDDDFAYFTTKYCDGGDLDQYLENERPGIIKAVDIVMDIASGTSFLHANGYVHRDLKLQNALCDSGTFVIGDFGSVAPCGADGFCNTLTQHSLIYRPPEVVAEKKHYKRSDVYQLGLILYQVLGGTLSYNERDWLTAKQLKQYDLLEFPDNQIFAASVIEGRIKAGRIVDVNTLPPYVPFALRSLIRKATNVDLTKRHNSVADFLAALNNLKGGLPDWSCRDGSYLLQRKKKALRVDDSPGGIAIFKDTGNGWKRYHGQVPASMTDAIQIAETL